MSTAQTTTDRITPAQMKCIWGMAKRLGLDSDMLHALVAGEGLGDHISTLTNGEAAKVIDALEGYLSDQSDRSDQSDSSDKRQLSPLLRSKIWKMAFLNWGDATPEAQAETRRRLRLWICATQPELFRPRDKETLSSCLLRMPPTIAENLIESLKCRRMREQAKATRQPEPEPWADRAES